MKFQFQLIADTQWHITLMGNLLKTHWPLQSGKHLSYYAVSDSDGMPRDLSLTASWAHMALTLGSWAL